MTRQSVSCSEEPHPCHHGDEKDTLTGHFDCQTSPHSRKTHRGQSLVRSNRATVSMQYHRATYSQALGSASRPSRATVSLQHRRSTHSQAPDSVIRLGDIHCWLTFRRKQLVYTKYKELARSMRPSHNVRLLDRSPTRRSARGEIRATSSARVCLPARPARVATPRPTARAPQQNLPLHTPRLRLARCRWQYA